MFSSIGLLEMKLACRLSVVSEPSFSKSLCQWVWSLPKPIREFVIWSYVASCSTRSRRNNPCSAPDGNLVVAHTSRLWAVRSCTVNRCLCHPSSSGQVRLKMKLVPFLKLLPSPGSSDFIHASRHTWGFSIFLLLRFEYKSLGLSNVMFFLLRSIHHWVPHKPHSFLLSGQPSNDSHRYRLLKLEMKLSTWDRHHPNPHANPASPWLGSLKSSWVEPVIKCLNDQKSLGRARMETSEWYVKTSGVGSVALHDQTIPDATSGKQALLEPPRAKTATDRIPT